MCRRWRTHQSAQQRGVVGVWGWGLSQFKFLKAVEGTYVSECVRCPSNQMPRALPTCSPTMQSPCFCGS